MAYKTKVQINGVTIKDDSLGGSDPGTLYNWSYEKTADNQIGILTMDTTTGVNDLLTLVVGQTVEIFAGFTTSTDKKIFSGFIADFVSEAGQIKFTCKDRMWDLVRRNVNKVYEDTGPQAGQVSAIATDLIETFGGLTASVQATGLGATDTIAEFRCDNTDIWERLVSLALAVNYRVWYDPVLNVVNFKQGGFNDSGITLTVGTEIINVPEWMEDTSRMVNDLRVDGAVVNTAIRAPLSGAGEISVTTDFTTTGITLDKTPESVELLMDSVNPPTTIREGGTKDASTTHFYYVDKQNKKVVPKTGTTFPANDFAIVNFTWLAPAPIHQTNPSSISLYGTWEKTVTLSDITTIADAERRTADILAKFSIPFQVGNDLQVDNTTDPGVELGDKLVIVDTLSVPNINAEYVITKQILSYPGTTQSLYVGDEAIKLENWQMDVETRIKRLEELLTLQNQDLILELIDFSNEAGAQPRYRQITKRDTSTDSIWGLAVWGTDNWDGTFDNNPVDHWIEQYLDTYEENFTDADFKDPVTTAAWTTTGAVVL